MNPKGWEIKPLNDVLRILYRYPTFYGCDYVEIGVPVLKIGSINENGSVSRDIEFYDKVTSEFSDRFSKTIVELNDLVMAVRGDTTGKIGIVPPELVGANISPNLIRLSSSEKVCKPQYLFWVLHYGKPLIEKRINDTAKKSLTATNLKDVPIPVPPIAKQEEFKNLYERVISVKSHQTSIYIKYDDLFNSLLQRAFRGEL